MWEGSWRGWAWLEFSVKRHLREGRSGLRVCIWGDNIFLYTLHKKPSPELSGFHHPSLIQGCSKSETRRKSGRLAGTWRGLKGAGGWEHPSWAGLVSTARSGGSPFPQLWALPSAFYLLAEEISQLFPLSCFQRTDVPHCRNAEQLRQKLEISE